MMELCVNMLLESDNEQGKRIDRVLYVDYPHGKAVLIDTNDANKGALPKWQSIVDIEAELDGGRFTVLDVDALTLSGALMSDEQQQLMAARLPVPEDAIPEKHRKIRDAAWQVIGPLVLSAGVSLLHPKTRGPLVAELAANTGKSRKVIYAYLRRYLQRGQTKNSLLPDYHKCGKTKKQSGEPKRGRKSRRSLQTGEPTGVNIDEHRLALIQQGLRDFYLQPRKPTLQRAYEQTMAAYFYEREEKRDGVTVPILLPADQRPTYDQFRYWCEKLIDPTSKLQKREGRRRFPLKHRDVLGDSTHMAFGPGSIFQIDPTIADVYLVSSLDRQRIIGRPVVYFVVDTFSRLIVGFEVGLEGPSWVGAMQALENAATDKVAFCQQYDIPIIQAQWPSHHLPEAILADRGEMEGYNADNLVNGLNIRISNTPPYRPDWKGIIERNFRSVNDRVVHWLPGAVYDLKERGGPNYVLDGCLNLREFRQILIRSIIYHNNANRLDSYPRQPDMIADQVAPYPRQLWEWGIENRTGALRVMDRDAVRLNLLPFVKGGASITASGITFQKLRYTSDIAQLEQWFVKARDRGSERADVVWDPRDSSIIYLVLGDRQRLLPCHLLAAQETFRNCEWNDVLDYFALTAVQSESARTADEQAQAELNAHIDAIVSVAQQETRATASSESDRSRTIGIAANRQDERKAEGKVGAWRLRGPESTAPAEDVAGSVAVSSAETPLDAYVPPDQLWARKRKAQREAVNNNQEEKGA